MGVAAVILAGGKGERFGGNKLLARMPSGETVIERVVEAVRSSSYVEEVFLAVRSTESGERFSAMFKAPYLVDAIEEEGPHAAMLTALKVLDYDEYLFIPGDVPHVRGETLDSIISVARSYAASCASPFWGNGVVEALLTYYNRKGESCLANVPLGLKKVRPSDLHRASSRAVLVGVLRLTRALTEFSNVNKPEDLVKPEVRGVPTDKVVVLTHHSNYYRAALNAIRAGRRGEALKFFALEASTYVQSGVHHLAYHAYLDCVSLGSKDCARMASESREAMGIEALHG